MTLQPASPPVPAAAEPRAAIQGRFYDLLRLALAGTVIALAIWLLKDVLTVVFAASLLAVILHGLAGLLRRATRLPYWASLLIVVLALLAALVGLITLAGPGIVTQADALRQALGRQEQGLHDRLSQSRLGQVMLQQVPASLGGSKASGAPGVSSGLAGSVAGFLGSAFGLFGTVAVIVIAGLYLAASPSTYANGIMRLVPPPHRARAKELLGTAGHALWMWSAGQAVDMLVVGLLSGIGLWLLGVPLALVLGIIAALFNFVPYIGAITGSVPAILIAFSVSAATGLETVALYLAIQGFEGNVMAPLIQKRAVDLPPGLTILSQTAFGAILGIPGLIFATPLTAALLAVLNKATPQLEPGERM